MGFLLEHNEIRYFGAKSADGRHACLAACPRDAQAIWFAGFSDLKDDQQVGRVGGTVIAETVLVSDGYDVDARREKGSSLKRRWAMGYAKAESGRLLFQARTGMTVPLFGPVEIYSELRAVSAPVKHHGKYFQEEDL